MLDFNAEHPVQLSEVSDLEVHAQAGLEFLDEADGGGDDRAIVHMHHDDCKVALCGDGSEVNSLVYSTLLEPKGIKNT